MTSGQLPVFRKVPPHLMILPTAVYTETAAAVFYWPQQRKHGHRIEEVPLNERIDNDFESALTVWWN